ncbi:MAG: ferredoxin [Lachnospiraceae bacterium]|nr:ferredoxin [Lachnospiraceae bacterium]
MRIELADYCIRCGICEDLYPELFKRNYEEHCIDVLYDEIPAELEESAKKAADDCAVAAIRIKKEK